MGFQTNPSLGAGYTFCNNNIDISAGSIAKGKVIDYSERKGIGRNGYVEIELISVSAVDGTPIQLADSHLTKEGKNKMILSIILSACIFPLFLLMKGKQAVIPAGTFTNALVAKDTQVSIR